MPILFPMHPTNPLPDIDAVIKTWSQVTAPIYIEELSPSGKPTGAIDLLGSAFLASKKGFIFFVTAAHVLEGIATGLALTTNIGGKGLLLNRRPFLISKEDDLAFTLLDQSWTGDFGIDRAKTVNLDDPKSSYSTLETYVSIGYPGSKNGLNRRLEKTKINIHGTSFRNKLDRPTCKPHIQNPIAFEFNKKTALNSQMSRTNPPSFSGTSGGPIFEIVAKVKYDDSISLSCRLEGVFLGWHKREREIIGASANALSQLIDEAIERMVS